MTSWLVAQSAGQGPKKKASLSQKMAMGCEKPSTLIKVKAFHDSLSWGLHPVMYATTCPAIKLPNPSKHSWKMHTSPCIATGHRQPQVVSWHLGPWQNVLHLFECSPPCAKSPGHAARGRQSNYCTIIMKPKASALIMKRETGNVAILMPYSDTSLFATLCRSSKTSALCFSRRSGQTAGLQSFRGSSGTTFALWASMALASAQGLPDLVLIRKLLELARLAFAEAPHLHISWCTFQSFFHFHYLLSLLRLHSWLICLCFGRTNFGPFGLFGLFLLQMRWARSLRWARFACQGLVCSLE